MHQFVSFIADTGMHDEPNRSFSVRETIQRLRVVFLDYWLLLVMSAVCNYHNCFKLS